jgi:hypothetical protein
VLPADEPTAPRSGAPARPVGISPRCRGGPTVVGRCTTLLAARFCHRIVLMQAGCAVAAGAPEDVVD